MDHVVIRKCVWRSALANENDYIVAAAVYVALDASHGGMTSTERVKEGYGVRVNPHIGSVYGFRDSWNNFRGV